MQCYNPVTVLLLHTRGLLALRRRSSVAISASSFAITSNYVTFLFSLSWQRYRINAVGDAECQVDTFISNMSLYMVYVDCWKGGLRFQRRRANTIFSKWQRILSEAERCPILRFFMLLNRIYVQKADYRYNPFATHAYTMLGDIRQRTFLHQNCWIIIFNLKLENLVMQMMRSGTEGCKRTMWQARITWL